MCEYSHRLFGESAVWSNENKHMKEESQLSTSAHQEKQHYAQSNPGLRS